MVAAPPPRTPGQYRIALVCLGNICRSPMADVVLAARVADAGVDDRVTVVSAGTGDWHAGDPMDRRAAALLTSEGYDASRHRAQQVPASWLDEQDLVLAMDHDNLRDLRDLGEADPARVRLFRDFDPDHPGGEVPDPYYGGDDGFRTVLTMVERTSDAIVAAVVDALDRPAPA
ncbi:low molecular weight phosphotyrosine protein phosphatase [Nocardioides carbamazepini]|uniref:low molecular weight protein-tyrosine-phosphatase n=1 Tax=Nocardioides carbamazepini TaxID=2854259 RepID=UPI002149DA5B|nr:low molecular weight protein-tyrosine-phosphatase [Nocardioides carbamazepini]MCR1784712.1 low molecular weight phosphotyrosine protein phosphatase [Nocardioides carbamazepini]